MNHPALPVGEPLTGHTAPVDPVACHVLDGRPVAVTGSWDNTVRVWDLTTRRVTAKVLTDTPRSIALNTSGVIAIAFHQDIALYRRQPRNHTTRD